MSGNAPNQEATNLQKNPTGKSAWGFVLLALGIIALVGVALYFLLMPGALMVVEIVILAVVAIIAVIAIVFAIVVALAAIPVYAAKGEQTQSGVDYSLDDVQPVEGKSLDDKE